MPSLVPNNSGSEISFEVCVAGPHMAFTECMFYVGKKTIFPWIWMNNNA